MTELITRLYDQLVLSHPRRIIVLLAVILTYFSWHAPDFKLDASTDSLLLGNDKDLGRYRQIARRYGLREFMFVTVTPHDDVFSKPSLDLIGKIRDDIEALDTVYSVISILDVPLVRGFATGLEDMAENFRLLESDDIDIDSARDEMLTSPVFRDLVVSAEGRTTAIQIFPVDFPEFRALRNSRNELLYQRANDELSDARKDELDRVQSAYSIEKHRVEAATHTAVTDIRAIMARYADRAEIHLGGIPMIVDDMTTFIRNDLLTFGAAVLVFLILMLWVVFREARWVALPLLSCGFAGVLMVGFLGLVGWEVTVISSNFISLMLIITMSMNIHLIVRYRELYRDLPDAEHYQLVRETTHHMVRPCLYTALTTVIAFASLAVSDIKPVVDFGWMMTIGLAVVFLTSFTLLPCVLLQTGKRPLKRPEGEHYRFTETLGRFTERHGAVVLLVAVGAGVLGLFGAQRLEVENSFIDYFHEDTEIYQGLKLIDEVLGGTTPAEIIIKFGRPARPGDDLFEHYLDSEMDDLIEGNETVEQDLWFTPEKIDRIKAVHDYLDGLPEVGKVLSLASIVRLAEDLDQGHEFDAFRLNDIYTRMPAALRQGLIDPYFSVWDNEARVSIRVVDSLPDLRRNELLEKIKRELEDELGLAPEEFEVAGLLVLYNNLLQSLFSSQIETLGVVMCGIMLMLWFLFGSLRVAIIGIVPNMLAAVTVLGFMGWMNIPLDMMTITIAAITIGIAVDDCIHYLYRYREELPVLKDYTGTMHYCHANIAKAAFYTTITVTVGFSILVLSNFIPTILFGLLTAVAMIIALLAALTLLPMLILWLRPFSTNPGAT